MRPKLLDLFCCEGGASEGYRRAGFEVYGVDLFKHKNAKGQRVGFSRSRYPFRSWEGDALAALKQLLNGGPLAVTMPNDQPGIGEWIWLGDIAAIHASPPCQHASAGTRAMRAAGTSEHPALIEPTRELLEQTGLPWVIENVSGAALRDPITLCGSQFGLAAPDEDGFPLRLERHRGFESNVGISAPGPCRHSARYDRHGGYVPSSLAVQQKLLGIDWMTKGGMAQSLPPAYTEHIGRQLMAHLEGRVAA